MIIPTELLDHSSYSIRFGANGTALLAAPHSRSPRVLRSGRISVLLRVDATGGGNSIGDFLPLVPSHLTLAMLLACVIFRTLLHRVNRADTPCERFYLQATLQRYI